MKIIRKIFFLLIVVFFASSLVKSIADYRKNLLFYQSYKKEYEDEKAKHANLQTQILKKSDPQEVEKTIRNQLNLVRENEIAIIIPPPSPIPTIFVPTPIPIYQQWWRVFFKE